MIQTTCGHFATNVTPGSPHKKTSNTMKHNKPAYRTAAKDGGANSVKTVLPPPSDTYRKEWDRIFGKKNNNKKDTANDSTK